MPYLNDKGRLGVFFAVLGAFKPHLDSFLRHLLSISFHFLVASTIEQGARLAYSYILEVWAYCQDLHTDESLLSTPYVDRIVPVSYLPAQLDSDIKDPGLGMPDGELQGQQTDTEVEKLELG